ncbi:hypothetical protein [Helicobacter didelphidarum]|nr:hypothetical protein [Helicobacter didelphidarum]
MTNKTLNNLNNHNTSTLPNNNPTLTNNPYIAYQYFLNASLIKE